MKNHSQSSERCENLIVWRMISNILRTFARYIDCVAHLIAHHVAYSISLSCTTAPASACGLLNSPCHLTPLKLKLLCEYRILGPGQSAAGFESAQSQAPLGYGPRAEDVAAAVCFLSESRAVTGQTIFVDCGERFQVPAPQPKPLWGCSVLLPLH